MQQIIWPLELYVIDTRVRCDRVANRQPGDEWDLVRQAMILHGQDEGDGKTPVARPPRVRPAPPAGDLVRGQHDRGGEELMLLSQTCRVVVGASQAGEEV